MLELLNFFFEFLVTILFLSNKLYLWLFEGFPLLDHNFALSPAYLYLFNILLMLQVFDNLSHVLVFICELFNDSTLQLKLLLLPDLFILNFILNFSSINLWLYIFNQFDYLFFCIWFTLSFSWAILVSSKLFFVFGFCIDLRFTLILILLLLKLLIDVFQLFDLNCKIFLTFFVCFLASFGYNFFNEHSAVQRAFLQYVRLVS